MSKEQNFIVFINKLTDSLKKNKSVYKINSIINEQLLISNFFNNIDEVYQFSSQKESFYSYDQSGRDFGDFQTPYSLTNHICEFLFNLGFNPDIVIEPTCGEGNFVISALKYFPALKKIIAIDIQPSYEHAFKKKILISQLNNKKNSEIHFIKGNIFKIDLEELLKRKNIRKSDQIIALGNPPWLTNAELSKLNSDNIPVKKNLTALKGLDAITGKANFDISENIIFNLIKSLPENTIFAFLLKYTVIRNLIRNMDKYNVSLQDCKAFLIDTSKEFKVNISAGLFIFKKGPSEVKTCNVYSFYRPDKLLYEFGIIREKFVSNIELYDKVGFIEGISPFVWRQGIKHDATKLLVLDETHPKTYVNGLNKKVDIEEDLIYPLVKSSHLNQLMIKSTTKKLIVTQSNIGQNTNYIKEYFPKSWLYLIGVESLFELRKSIIYKNKPKFSIFGVGDYSFKKYKIAVSGFNKKINFTYIPPIDNKPVMLDDTCYFLSFDHQTDALIVWGLLNSKIVFNYLSSIVFLDNKRPYTKDILMRMDIKILLNNISFENFLDTYSSLNSKFDIKKITKEDYIEFTELLLKN